MRHSKLVEIHGQLVSDTELAWVWLELEDVFLR